MSPMTDLEVAVGAAWEGAAVVARGLETGAAVSYKGRGNPVTETDVAAERAIRTKLLEARPTDAVLGEEEGGEGWEHGRVWVVDPLDGTVNFVHGIPQVAVSVALWADGRPVVGVVVDVARNEMFAASGGGGATRAGRSMVVSSRADLGESLVATGFPYDRHVQSEYYAAVVARALREAQDLRRLGSAALDLAWVACGRLEGYWERGVRPWDTAAGLLLVTEAGGLVTNLEGDEYRLSDSGIVASNGLIHRRLLGLLGP